MQAQIFNASAGSGKTYRLAYKYVRDVVREPIWYRHTLAVTFTNKATEEMKSRILREIDTLARGAKSPYMDSLCEELKLSPECICQRARTARSYILHDYSRFTVLTIDKFFQRILRAFIQELGLDLNYNIEIESSTLLERSADNLLEQITSNEELRSWLLEFVAERVEDGRRWDIVDGILALGGELLKESNREILKSLPPKERIRDIVGRTVHRASKSREEYAALGKRAMEVMQRVGCNPSDFKGQSRSFAYTFQRIAQGEIKSPSKSFRDMGLSSEGWCNRNPEAQAAVGELLPILRDICEHYDRDVKLWNTSSLVRERYRSFALLGDLYERVKSQCDAEGIMLLGETKHILSEFIRDNDAPFIYEKTGNRFERFMIDEFQDTSKGEWGNFLPLLKNAMSQSEDSTVLLVGDIKQSIYRWRGGDWRILHTQAQQELGQGRVEVVTLQDNFRSLPRVVEFNNAIIEAVVECENSHLNELISATSVEMELKDMLRKAYASHSQIPRKRAESDGYVELSTFVDVPPIINSITSAVDRGFSPSDIMILVRTNNEGVAVANMLLEFKEQNTNPLYRFDIMTREALIVGSSPVSGFVIANMKLSQNEGDLTQLAIYNKFLGRENINEPLAKEDEDMLRSVKLKSLEEAFEEIVIYHRLEREHDSIAYLQALHDQLLNYSSSRIADIALFVKWWEEQGSQKSLSVEHSPSSIEITTIHKAKGLEKRVVIIPYCNWSLEPKIMNTVWTEAGAEVEALGSFPVAFKSTTMRESQFSSGYYREVVYSHIDNINLLYVALTRAVESLHIFIPRRETKSPRKATTTRVGELLLRSIPAGAEFTDNGDSISYTFGVAAPPVKQMQAKRRDRLHIMTTYPTSKCDLRLRLPSTRYREDSGVASQARHIGVLMHKVFDEAYSVEDIFKRLDVMMLNGYINESEYSRVKSSIVTSLENPLIQEWFGGQWDEVRCESDIIIPKSGDIRRPDRVMMRGKRAVVVDYKFGTQKSSQYKKQLRGYMELLMQMGYVDVEGYIWYIKSGEIVGL